MPAVTVSATTSTEIVPASINRVMVAIKNTSTSADLHLSFGGTATTNDYFLSPGESFIDSPNRPMKVAINGLSSSGNLTAKYSQLLTGL